MSKRKTLTVLIADGSRAMVERLTDILERVRGLKLIGYAVTAQETTHSIQELRPDVVILDLQMTNGRGINVLRAIKSSSPDIRVIILSNFPYPQYRKKCLEAGADFFLDKSLDFSKMPEILRDLMANSLG